MWFAVATLPHVATLITAFSEREHLAYLHFSIFSFNETFNKKVLLRQGTKKLNHPKSSGNSHSLGKKHVECSVLKSAFQWHRLSPVSTKCSHLCPNANPDWRHPVHRHCQLQRQLAVPPATVCPWKEPQGTTRNNKEQQGTTRNNKEQDGHAYCDQLNNPIIRHSVAKRYSWGTNKIIPQTSQKF